METILAIDLAERSLFAVERGLARMLHQHFYGQARGNPVGYTLGRCLMLHVCVGR